MGDGGVGTGMGGADEDLCGGKGNLRCGRRKFNLGLEKRDGKKDGKGGMGVGVGISIGGGRGRWRRDAARRSPGASNATAGRPYVAPSRLAREPPKECPTSQTLAVGYMWIRSSTSFYRRSWSVLPGLHNCGRTHNSDGVEQAILD